MKRITSLLVGCSLALTGAALAQQPVEHQSPSKGKRAPERAQTTEAHPVHAGKPQQRPAKQTAVRQHSATNERSATDQSGAEKGQKAHMNSEAAAGQRTNVHAKAAGESANEPGKQRKAEAHGEAANANTTRTDVSRHAAGMPTHVGDKQAKERKKGQGVKQPATEAGATSTTGQQNAKEKPVVKGKKPDVQQVQQVKSQHTSFRAQARPQQVPAVTFNQNYHIEGSRNWQGQQYEVFRSYQPQWHDQGWYRSRYQRVQLIGGGYYFFNAGYWYPAWGYSPSEQYYAYDGPIYVGQSATPPDQIIADTQALLQEMGYYRGEVDGLLGPLTREALTAYQNDQGLPPTAAIDEPTLDSLGLS